MAKKKPVEAPVEAAPVSDASIPTVDHSHKDPAQRAHMWERPARIDERPAAAAPHADYQHELPRFLHKGIESKVVSTPDACDEALADGWVLHPEN